MPFNYHGPDHLVYRGGVNPWVKGYVCFILKFALPPFLPLSPLECKNKTGTEPFIPEYLAPVPCTYILSNSVSNVRPHFKA